MNSPHGNVRRARRPSPRRFCTVLGTMLAGVACVGVTQTQMQTSEVQVRAAFIYNFALFTNRSADVMQADTPVVVCVTAQHLLQTALEKLTRKPVRGHRLEIRRISDGTVTGYHVLVFDTRASNGVRVDPTTPVLTMSDSPKSARTSSTPEPIIALTLHDDRVVFDIGIVAARQARLQISSQLLHLTRSMQ